MIHKLNFHILLQIKELVEETGNESREVKRIYTTIFSFLTTLAILTCVDLYQSLSKSYHLNKEGIYFISFCFSIDYTWLLNSYRMWLLLAVSTYISKLLINKYYIL